MIEETTASTLSESRGEETSRIQTVPQWRVRTRPLRSLALPSPTAFGQASSCIDKRVTQTRHRSDTPCARKRDISPSYVPYHHRHVFGVIVDTAISHSMKLPVHGGKGCDRMAPHLTLGDPAKAHQISDSYDFEVMLDRESLQFCPRAISAGLSVETISHRPLAGHSLARRARSIAASACPLCTSTPPSRAARGTTCPGRVKSPGSAVGAARAAIVRARSAARCPCLLLRDRQLPGSRRRIRRRAYHEA